MPVLLKQRGVRPSKPLSSSINSFKSSLKIDLKPKTIFVAEIGNFCCFLATQTLKFPDRNFWHWDPPGPEKTRLFRKNVDFFDLTEYSALFEGGAQWQKFLPDPNFSTYTIFQLSCKKIMSETFLGQKLCHGEKSRINPLCTFLAGFNAGGAEVRRICWILVGISRYVWKCSKNVPEYQN